MTGSCEHGNGRSDYVVSCACYTSRPYHPSWSDRNNIWWWKL